MKWVRVVARGLRLALTRTSVGANLQPEKSVFDRYNITSEEDLREASRRLQTYLKNVTVQSPNNLPTNGATH